MRKTVMISAICVICIFGVVFLSSCSTNDSYFVFEPNADETGYIITSTEKILPKRVTLPARYSGKPVVAAVITSKTIEYLKIGKNIETLSVSGEKLSKIKPNKHFTMKDGVLYNADITRIVYVMDNAPKDYYIPRTVVSADEYAFNYAEIEQVFVPVEYTNYYYEIDKATGNSYIARLGLYGEIPYEKIHIYDDKTIINFEATEVSDYRISSTINCSSDERNYGVSYE